MAPSKAGPRQRQTSPRPVIIESWRRRQVFLSTTGMPGWNDRWRLDHPQGHTARDQRRDDCGSGDQFCMTGGTRPCSPAIAGTPMRAARGVLTDAVEFDLEPARQNAHDVWTLIDRRGAKCANERCIHRGVPLQARGKPAHKAQPPGSMAEARQRPQALPGRRNAGQPDRPAQRRLER
jgi:hypothetical protein